MLTAVITFLIWLCVVAIVIYLVIYVLRDVIGLPIPPKVIPLIWAIVMLLAILWLVQTILPMAGHRIGSLVPAIVLA